MGITRYRLPVVLYTQHYVHNDFAQVISNQYFCAHSSPDELLRQVSILLHLAVMSHARRLSGLLYVICTKYKDVLRNRGIVQWRRHRIKILSLIDSICEDAIILFCHSLPHFQHDTMATGGLVRRLLLKWILYCCYFSVTCVNGN